MYVFYVYTNSCSIHFFAKKELDIKSLSLKTQVHSPENITDSWHFDVFHIWLISNSESLYTKVRINKFSLGSLVKRIHNSYAILIPYNSKSLTHSLPIHPFSTPWKYQKTFRFSAVGSEWVKQLRVKYQMSLNYFVWEFCWNTQFPRLNVVEIGIFYKFFTPGN